MSKGLSQFRDAGHYPFHWKLSAVSFSFPSYTFLLSTGGEPFPSFGGPPLGVGAPFSYNAELQTCCSNFKNTHCTQWSIWTRYTWIFSCYSQTKIQKGTKFIGQCTIPSLIFPASSFQFIDFHCWLSHVHLLLGGHFISLLLIFSAYSALLHVCVSLPLISIVCCQPSDVLFAQWAVRFRMGGWGSHCIKLNQSLLTDSIVLCNHFRVLRFSLTD